LDHIKNTGCNTMDSRDLRDNFKDIQKFMDAENIDGSKTGSKKQIQNNRDLRDNFKNIRGFTNQE